MHSSPNLNHDREAYSQRLLLEYNSDHSVSVYQKRQKEFLNKLKVPLFIQGVLTDPFSNHPWTMLPVSYNQEPLMRYLTGIDQPGCALLLTKTERIVFLPTVDVKKVFWEGPVLSFGDHAHNERMCALLGVDAVADSSTIDNKLYAICSTETRTKICLYKPNESTGKSVALDECTHAQVKREKRLKRKLPTLEFQLLSFEDLSARLCLEKASLSVLQEGIEKTASIFTSILDQKKTFKTERDLFQVLQSEIYLQTPFGPSFSPIVASGKNACTLHYIKNDSPLENGAFVLLDFGIRWHHIVTDVTRMIPIGKLSPLHELIYTIVLRANAWVTQTAKEGVSIDTLNKGVWQLINESLDREIRQKGGVVTLSYKESPHNVSHLIAHQVHDGDPKRDYKREALKSGMIISNEPGIYGFFELEIDGKHYSEHIGVRIEDMLLIAKDSAICLTEALSKKI